MVAGGAGATAVFVLNQTLQAHYFVSEVFAGLGASAVAMWLVSRSGPVSAAEYDVLRCVRGYPSRSHSE
jgi:hypothetical protein